MLRRADNCRLTVRSRLFGRREIYFHIGKASYLVYRGKREELEVLLNQQMQLPLRICSVGERTYWQFKNRFFWENDGLKLGEVHALLVTRQQRERATIERAQQIVAQGLQPKPSARGALPDDVKQLVWLRDGGKCRSCGAISELQFDHIIPVAMGGSDAADNLQVLCGPCNRSKGAGITAGPVKPNSYMPPAGWYDDPDGTSTKRYWDGSRWTEHVTRDL